VWHGSVNWFFPDPPISHGSDDRKDRESIVKLKVPHSEVNTLHPPLRILGSHKANCGNIKSKTTLIYIGIKKGKEPLTIVPMEW